MQCRSSYFRRRIREWFTFSTLTKCAKCCSYSQITTASGRSLEIRRNSCPCPAILSRFWSHQLNLATLSTIPFYSFRNVCFSENSKSATSNLGLTVANPVTGCNVPSRFEVVTSSLPASYRHSSCRSGCSVCTLLRSVRAYFHFSLTSNRRQRRPRGKSSAWSFTSANMDGFAVS